MKIRESGMPDRKMWESFFNAEKILETLGINNKIDNVAEFGCGYGTFTIAVAKIIQGKIYAIDIEPEMISVTKNEAVTHGLKNVVAVSRDFMAEGSGLEDESVDYAMLFNILHLENPVALLLEAKRILKSSGRIGIIHWNYDSKTPRGPSMDIRPKPEQCIKWAQIAGFCDPARYDLKPYHYGIVLTKNETTK
jgi:ubiquinone/menaquinone biosynthesis C-methylase UbiE